MYLSALTAQVVKFLSSLHIQMAECSPNARYRRVSLKVIQTLMRNFPNCIGDTGKSQFKLFLFLKTRKYPSLRFDAKSRVSQQKHDTLQACNFPNERVLSKCLECFTPPWVSLNTLCVSEGLIRCDWDKIFRIKLFYIYEQRQKW